MHPIRWLVPLCVSLLWVVAPAGAQADGVVTWSRIEEALSAHPALRAGEQTITISRMEQRQARQYPNPELGLRLGAETPDAAPDHALVWELELSVPLVWPGGLVHQARAARHGEESARYEAQALRLHLWRELRALFLAVAFDQKRRELLHEAEADLRRLVELVALRVEQGEARPVEQSRALGELLEFQLLTGNQEGEAAARREHLALWLGGGSGEGLVVEARDLESLPRLPGRREALLALRDAHPLLQAALARTRQAQAAARAERHEALPAFGLGAFVGQEADSTRYGGLVTLELPLWNWNLGGIAKADALSRRTMMEQEQTERDIREALLAAHARAEAAQRALVRCREELLPVAQEIIHDTERLYASGETGLTDVLEARRASWRARESYQTELFNYHMALLELGLWMGGFLHD